MALALPAGTLAQSPAPQDIPQESYAGAAPAHVALVDGSATLEREGAPETALTNVPLLAGDRLVTAQGRVEVLYGDGSVLDLDQGTTVDLLSDTLLRLDGGSVRLRVDAPPAASDSDLQYRVDTPAGSVTIGTAGDYRVDLSGTSAGATEVSVLVSRGSALLENQYGQTAVRAGSGASALTDAAPSVPYGFNSAQGDDFDQWVAAQDSAELGSASAQYLPPAVLPYGPALDQYGTWGYEPTDGYVWYPSVATGWRPYSNGLWSFYGAFGWTWVGLDVWSWPTHHYGRWGLAGGRWFWVPGREWSPAWVAWASAPGYVGWCPLGVNGLAVVDVGAFRRGYGDAAGWSVMASGAFRSNVRVDRTALSARALPLSVRGDFAEQRSAPIAQARLGANVRAPLVAPAAGAAARDRFASAWSHTAATRPGGTFTAPRDSRVSSVRGAAPSASAPDARWRGPATAPSAGRTPAPERFQYGRAPEFTAPRQAGPSSGRVWAGSGTRSAPSPLAQPWRSGSAAGGVASGPRLSAPMTRGWSPMQAPRAMPHASAPSPMRMQAPTRAPSPMRAMPHASAPGARGGGRPSGGRAVRRGGGGV